jgi:hypothetical protein
MLFNILGLISFITDLLPLILLLAFSRVIKDPPFTALFGWTIFSVLSDILIMTSDDKTDQFVVFVAVIAELMFISMLFFLISKWPKFRFIYVLSGLIFITIGLVKYIREKPDNFDYLLGTLGLLNVLILSLFLLYELFTVSLGSFLLANPYVWFALGYIIYGSGNLFLFATTEYFPDIFKAENAQNPWSIFLVANILKNTLFCKAIMLQKKKIYLSKGF